MAAFPGAEVAIDWTPPAPMKPDGLFKARKVTTRRVTTCTDCELVENCTAPVSMTVPDLPIEFAVMGEAPGPTEDKRGMPFVGKSGQLLRHQMLRAKLDPKAAGWFNAVSCFPNTNGKVKTPTKAEVLACRTNLLMQRNALHTRYILLVGATALAIFRPDLRIMKHHGRVFLWDDTYIVMPITHPAAALRNPALKKVIREDLERWGDIVDGYKEPLMAITYTCVKCHENAVHMDRDGAGYCLEHWPTFGRNWEIARNRWRPGKVTVDQLSLLGEGEVDPKPIGKGDVL